MICMIKTNFVRFMKKLESIALINNLKNVFFFFHIYLDSTAYSSLSLESLSTVN